MIDQIVKDYREEFEEVLEEYDVFDVSWNDWMYLEFFVRKDLEIFMTREKYRILYQDKKVFGDFDFNRLIINCFNLYKHGKKNQLPTVTEGKVL